VSVLSVPARILVLSSCTGLKTRPADLLPADFDERRTDLAARRQELSERAVRAESLYSGQHHVRLMRGVKQARAASHLDVDLRIASAGYGLVRGSDPLVPYECTFQGLPKFQRQQLARASGLGRDVVTLLRESHDLALVLLGEDYLDACGLEGDLDLGGPTLVFCAPSVALRLSPLERLHVVGVGTDETRRFSCGLVGLKGEVGGRLLGYLAADPARLADLSADGLLDRLVEADLDLERQYALPVG
jgi:hypothetical protein